TDIAVPTEVFGDNGDDEIMVDSNGLSARGIVNGIKSILSVSGGGGLNALSLDDTSERNSNTVTVTVTTIGAAADNYFGPGGGVAYDGIQTLTEIGRASCRERV